MNGDWQEGKTVYTFGYETIHKQHLQSSERLNFKLDTFNSNQWRNNIKMRAAAPSIWNLELAESKKDYGVMVHTALAKIRSVEDIELAVNSMFLEGLVASGEKEKLLMVITNIIELPQLKAHFAVGLKVKNESEIISMSGEKFRLDRVVFHAPLKKEEGQVMAVIIDYKTGEEKAEHKKQILQYADLLNQMGYIVKDRLLVYIEEQKVLEC